MRNRDPGAALRFYRLLLRLYPPPFRERYGPELIQFVRDGRAATAPGRLAGLRFWVEAGGDLAASAIRLRMSGARGAGAGHERALERATRLDPPGRRIPAPAADDLVPRVGVRDFGFALRSLRRSPAYFATTLATLGLAIGTSTAIFSIVDHVVLRPLAYPEAGRLIVIGAHRGDGIVRGLSSPNAVDLAARATTLDGVGVSRVMTLDLTGDGEPVRMTAAAVSPAYLETLGARALHGRTLRPGDNRAGVERVGVVSHGAWLERWGGDPGVVGRTITANRGPLTIVGVMPASFRGPEALGQGDVDVWIPVAFVERGANPLANRADQFLSVVARLTPGATLDAARAEVETVGTALVEAFPAENAPRGQPIALGVESLHEVTSRSVRPRLALLLGAVGLLFLAGLANAAYLMVARTVERRQELGLRQALGAGAARISRLCVSEAVLIAVLAGALGLVVALGEVQAFLAFQPPGVPRTAEIALDLRVLGFALLISLATGLLIGMVTGARGVRVDPMTALRGGGRNASEDRGEGAIRSALLVAETAFALVLLLSGGLLMRSFVHLMTVPLGFETDGVAAMEVFVGGWYASSQERIEIYRDLMREVEALPGVAAAGVTTDLPLSASSKGAPIYAGDTADPSREPDAVAGFHYVSPGYFDALSVELVSGGRDFTDLDVDEGSDVAIVSERLAGRLFPGAAPVGRRISMASLNGSQPPLTVVGVARDVRHQTLQSDETAEIYVPHTGGFIGPPLNVVVRGSLPFAQLVPALREAVRRVNPDLPIGEIIPLRERVWRAVALPRFFAVVFGIFAAAAVAIATAGIYGSMSYAAARRRREIGVRVALGARPGQVVGLMLRRAAVLSAVGILAGLALSLPMSGLIRRFLFGVEPFDPPTLAAAALALGMVQMLAGLGPARRSSRGSVLETLRD